jgi:hypothetical protein
MMGVGGGGVKEFLPLAGPHTETPPNSGRRWLCRRYCFAPSGSPMVRRYSAN